MSLPGSRKGAFKAKPLDHFLNRGAIVFWHGTGRTALGHFVVAVVEVLE